MKFEHRQAIHPLTDTVGMELFLQGWVAERPELFEQGVIIELIFTEEPNEVRLIVEGREGVETANVLSANVEDIGNELIEKLPFQILFPF